MKLKEIKLKDLKEGQQVVVESLNAKDDSLGGGVYWFVGYDSEEDWVIWNNQDDQLIWERPSKRRIKVFIITRQKDTEKSRRNVIKKTN